jgi:hypothetical protein
LVYAADGTLVGVFIGVVTSNLIYFSDFTDLDVAFKSRFLPADTGAVLLPDLADCWFFYCESLLLLDLALWTLCTIFLKFLLAICDLLADLETLFLGV